MSDKDILYGYVMINTDNLKCIINLYSTVGQYISDNSIKTEFYHEWSKNRSKYYNNFEISSTKVWFSPEYQDYINMIDHAGGIYYNRWGDSPIKGIAITMFVPQNKTHCFCDVGYKHGSVIRGINQENNYTCSCAY
jgi:hypothetical protein